MKRRNSELCKSEEKINADNFLTEIFLLLKGEYIAKTHCNGEKISMEFLNGQKFEIYVKEL